VLGLVAGGIPLFVAQLRGSQVDPFDYGISYLAWCGTAFLAALVLAYTVPHHRVLAGLSILMGFLGAMVLEIVIDFNTGRTTHNLWPLTLVLSAIISAPPAFVGAYLGSRLRL
jgi:hypothetical protein